MRCSKSFDSYSYEKLKRKKLSIKGKYWNKLKFQMLLTTVNDYKVGQINLIDTFEQKLLGVKQFTKLSAIR